MAGSFGYAVETYETSLKMAEMDLLPETLGKVEFFVAQGKFADLKDVMQATSVVRRQRRSCGLSYRPVSLKKQMQQASGQGVKFIVLVGTEMADPARLVVKELLTGKQAETTPELLEDALRESAPGDPKLVELLQG